MSSEPSKEPQSWKLRFTPRVVILIGALVALLGWGLVWVNDEFRCYRRDYLAAQELEDTYGATFRLDLLGAAKQNVRPQFDLRELQHGRLYRPIRSVTVRNQTLDESFLLMLLQFRELPATDLQDCKVEMFGLKDPIFLSEGGSSGINLREGRLNPVAK